MEKKISNPDAGDGFGPNPVTQKHIEEMAQQLERDKNPTGADALREADREATKRARERLQVEHPKKTYDSSDTSKEALRAADQQWKEETRQKLADLFKEPRFVSQAGVNVVPLPDWRPDDLPIKLAQPTMDALWKAGIRPSGVQFIQAEDVRVLVDRLHSTQLQLDAIRKTVLEVATPEWLGVAKRIEEALQLPLPDSPFAPVPCNEPRRNV